MCERSKHQCYWSTNVYAGQQVHRYVCAEGVIVPLIFACCPHLLRSSDLCMASIGTLCTVLYRNRRRRVSPPPITFSCWPLFLGGPPGVVVCFRKKRRTSPDLSYSSTPMVAFFFRCQVVYMSCAMCRKIGSPSPPGGTNACIRSKSLFKRCVNNAKNSCTPR